MNIRKGHQQESWPILSKIDRVRKVLINEGLLIIVTNFEKFDIVSRTIPLLYVFTPSMSNCDAGRTFCGLKTVLSVILHCQPLPCWAATKFRERAIAASKFSCVIALREIRSSKLYCTVQGVTKVITVLFLDIKGICEYKEIQSIGPAKNLWSG